MRDILTAIGLTAVLVTALWGFFDLRLPKLALIGLYVAIYALLAWRTRAAMPRPAADDEPEPDFSHWPTSGPIGRFGQRGLLVPWYASQMLSLLNPFQLIELMRQLRGNAALEALEKATGDDGTGYETIARYTLPLRESWLVYNGGMTRKTSHSWDIIGQRFALDFVQADARFARHTGRGTRLDAYFCYGKPILAAADGTVVTAEERIGAAPFLGWGICDALARSFVGNHLVIQHAEGEFALYAHLIRGSLRVGPGDTVRRGQVIGLCGHTGHSTEPHLHFHLQDSADLFGGRGLPIRFTDLEVDGKPAEGVHLTAGNRVRSLRAETGAEPHPGETPDRDPGPGARHDASAPSRGQGACACSRGEPRPPAHEHPAPGRVPCRATESCPRSRNRRRRDAPAPSKMLRRIWQPAERPSRSTAIRRKPAATRAADQGRITDQAELSPDSKPSVKIKTPPGSTVTLRARTVVAVSSFPPSVAMAVTLSVTPIGIGSDTVIVKPGRSPAASSHTPPPWSTPAESTALGGTFAISTVRASEPSRSVSAAAIGRAMAVSASPSASATANVGASATGTTVIVTLRGCEVARPSLAR